MSMSEGLPKNEGPRLSLLEQEDPEAFKFLMERIKEEGAKLLRPGESFAPESYEIMARYVARDAEQSGSPLTRESITNFDSARIDAMLNAAVVRHEHDNAPEKFIVTDPSQQQVIGTAPSLGEAMRVAEEKRNADTK